MQSLLSLYVPAGHWCCRAVHARATRHGWRALSFVRGHFRCLWRVGRPAAPGLDNRGTGRLGLRPRQKYWRRPGKGDYSQILPRARTGKTSSSPHGGGEIDDMAGAVCRPMMSNRTSDSPIVTTNAIFCMDDSPFRSKKRQPPAVLCQTRIGSLKVKCRRHSRSRE